MRSARRARSKTPPGGTCRRTQRHRRPAGGAERPRGGRGGCRGAGKARAFGKAAGTGPRSGRPAAEKMGGGVTDCCVPNAAPNPVLNQPTESNRINRSLQWPYSMLHRTEPNRTEPRTEPDRTGPNQPNRTAVPAYDTVRSMAPGEPCADRISQLLLHVVWQVVRLSTRLNTSINSLGSTPSAAHNSRISILFLLQAQAHTAKSWYIVPHGRFRFPSLRRAG